MKFKIQKKEVHGSDVFVIESSIGKGKHMLFLEWDEEVPRTTIRAMKALGIKGILIKTPRGYHFISRDKPLNFLEMIALQSTLGADPTWTSGNRKRKYASLRVSIKYEGENPLKVVEYPLTDEELKQAYEQTVRYYFYKGQWYFADSALDSIF